jgi:stress response protein YsnF
VKKHVVHEPITFEAEAAREEVLLERVPCDRSVDGPIPVRTEGDVTIVSVVEEIVVVEKRFVLKEEVRLTKRRTTRPAPVQSEIRREVVTVERVPPPQAGTRR